MVLDTDLEELGFTPFEHISKDKRDGKRRMIWGGVLDDDHNLLLITVVQTMNTWRLEVIKIDSDEVVRKYFTLDSKLDEVLQILRSHGHLTEPGD